VCGQHRSHTKKERRPVFLASRGGAPWGRGEKCSLAEKGAAIKLPRVGAVSSVKWRFKNVYLRGKWVVLAGRERLNFATGGGYSRKEGKKDKGFCTKPADKVYSWGRERSFTLVVVGYLSQKQRGKKRTKTKCKSDSRPRESWEKEGAISTCIKKQASFKSGSRKCGRKSNKSGSTHKENKHSLELPLREKGTGGTT